MIVRKKRTLPPPGSPLEAYRHEYRRYLGQLHAWTARHRHLPLSQAIVSFLQWRDSRAAFVVLRRIFADDPAAAGVDWHGHELADLLWYHREHVARLTAERNGTALPRPRAPKRGDYEVLWARFDRFATAHPETNGDLQRLLESFLSSLTPAVAAVAYRALRARYDGEEYEHVIRWKKLFRSSPPRDEAKLRATVLSAADRDQLDAANLSVRDRALLQTLYHVRRAEAAQLRWRDLNFEQRLIYVACGKGGRSRWVGMLRKTAEALLAWREEWPNHFGPFSPDAYVFLSTATGSLQHVHQDTIGRWAAEIFEQAGIKTGYRCAHALRRTLATEYLRANPKDLVGLKQQLGHARIATTEQYLFLEQADFTAGLDRTNL